MLQSCWTGTAPDIDWPALPPRGIAVDVAVIGGGVVGLTTALLLARAGRSVAVIEALRIGRQVTGGSTAKVTTQHGLIYAQLARDFGEDGARVYAQANQAGFDWIAERAPALDCDFRRLPAYVWTEDAARLQALREEAQVARRLGLPAAFDDAAPLPFAVAGAVRFDDQAEFHPVKYCLGLAREIGALGGQIFEHTRVRDVAETSPCRIDTERGAVTATDVVLATNLPILDRGGFFAKALPKRHLAVAAPVERPLDGMFISADSPSRSLRTAPADGGWLLVAVGEAFKTGHADTVARFAELEDWLRRRFAIGPVRFRWGNQDHYAVDRVPYVGALHPLTRRLWVATGFSAWGFTNGTAAAMMLADAILGRPSPWATLFHAQRIKPRVSGPELLRENAHVAAKWVKDRLSGAERPPLDRLAPGEGAIVRLGGEDVAAFRDESGVVHALSPVCTHMGCLVTWNAGERSWDCPCHGSRFAIDGTVLDGPAVRGLAPRKAGGS